MGESKYKFKEMTIFSPREELTFSDMLNTTSVPDTSKQQKKITIITYNVICFIGNFKEINQTNQINHERKNEWTKTFKEINSSLARDVSIDTLKKQIEASEKFLGGDIYASLKIAIKEARTLENQDDFIYSSLNMLSKYHEISEANGIKKLYLNRDKNLISIDIIKELNNYMVTLSMMFSPNGNVSFFTYDSDPDDGYSISGYMTPSKKYSSVKKIKSILNLLNQGER